MANTAKFSIYYKARVIKAIVKDSCRIHALGTTATGQNFSTTTVTDAMLIATPGASTLGSIVYGTIPFANLPTVYNTTGAQISNSAASTQLTIPAGRVVHIIALSNGEATDKVLTWVYLTTPDDNYYYEEVGTLTVPSGGYTLRHA